MNNTDYRLSLDIFKTASQATLPVKQFDTAYKLCVSITANGFPYKITEGCYALFTAKKPDGNFINNECTIENNTIFYQLTSQTTAALGIVECEIVLCDGNGEQLATPHFNIFVDKKAYNGEDIVSSSENGVLDSLVENADRAEAARDEAETAASNANTDANRAGTAAQSATTSAFDARGYKVAANESATKAKEAQQKAEEASAKVTRENVLFSNALKGTASGEVIGMHDVSPIEHEMGVKVSGKNLLNSNLRLTPRTDSGVTIQYLPEEDCYLLNGTSIDRSGYLVYEDLLVNDYITLTTKVVSGTIDNPNNDYTVFYVGGKNDINDSASNWMDIPIGYDNNRTSPNVRKYISSTWFYFGKGITFNNYKVKIQIEKGTTSTSYAPYVSDISAVKVRKYSGNLLNFPSVYSWNGAFPMHENTNVKTILKPNVRYAFSYDEIKYSAQGNGLVFVVNGVSIAAWTDAKEPYYFTLDKEVDSFYIYTNGWDAAASTNTTATVTNLRIYMAEDGYLDYEPYIEPTEYTPDADGVVSGVTSLYPSTTLITDTNGAVIDATYNKDINKAFEELKNVILSLGGNV